MTQPVKAWWDSKVAFCTPVSLVLVVGVLIHGVDKREVNCLSSCIAFEAAWYELSFFDDCYALDEPTGWSFSHGPLQ